MQEIGTVKSQDGLHERTTLHVSRQSRESLASSSHVSSSSFPFCSRACSAMRKKHQPSKYQASTSSSSEAIIPCRTIKAGVNSDNSRKSLLRLSRLAMGGNWGSSTEANLNGAPIEEGGRTHLRPSLSTRTMLSAKSPSPRRAFAETCERTRASAMLPYFPGPLATHPSKVPHNWTPQQGQSWRGTDKRFPSKKRESRGA